MNLKENYNRLFKDTKRNLLNENVMAEQQPKNSSSISIKVGNDTATQLKKRVEKALDRTIDNNLFRKWLESEVNYWFSGENDDFNRLFDEGFENSLDNTFGA